MRISAAIALLLAPASAVKIMKSPSTSLNGFAQVGENQTLAQIGRDVNPVVQVVSDHAVDGLQAIPIQDFASSLKWVVSNLNQDERNFDDSVTEADQYDPQFIADLVVAEYTAMLTDLSESKDNAAAVTLEGILLSTPLRPFLAQIGAKDFNPDQFDQQWDWCKTDSRKSLDLQCDILDILPVPSQILGYIHRGLKDLNQTAIDHPEARDDLVRNIEMFNSMLTQEADRLGVDHAKGFPDSGKFADLLIREATSAQSEIENNYEQMVDQISQTELDLAMPAAQAYQQAASLANRMNQDSNQVDVPTDSFHLNGQQETALQSGLLKAFKQANDRGQFSRIYSTLASFAAEVAIEDLKRPSVQDELMHFQNDAFDAARQMEERYH